MTNSILKLLEEEVEIPEDFRRQDVAFPDFLKFFTDKMSFRGQELPIWIDKGAFKEEAPDAEDIMDTNIRFPPYIKKMPIATALRIALSQVKGVPATYLIRRNVIEITTEYRFTVDKVIRVHPVADLVIPISQVGATQQFGQAGQTGFGGQIQGGFGGQIQGFNGGFGGGIGGFNGGFGGIQGGFGGGIGGFNGGFGGIQGGFGGFQPGSALGGTAGSFNGGSFTGGFNGSLGAVGGSAGMQELIKLITIVVDPGHWYYVQQQSPFQQGINNAFNRGFGVGGGFNGGGALGGGALGGALGGAGGGAPAAGPAPTPVGDGGPANLLDPKTNTIYPYMPTLALIIRAQARTHTSLTSGFTNKAAKAPADVMGMNDRGLAPLDQILKDRNAAKVAAAAADADPKDPKNKVKAILAKEKGANNGKAMDLRIDPEVWDSVLAEGNIPAEMIIATTETLFDQPDKKHAAEFLKANLRRGIVVRPWVFEALAIALEASGGDQAEIRRARLSAVALDPKDAEGFLEAARGMAENGQFDRALAFCRQAALIEPNLVFAYDQALAYASQAKDPAAMEWAASRLVSQDWPLDNSLLHLKAQTSVNSLAKTDAEKLRAALQALKQRDLVVNVTWQTPLGASAEVDLFVKEPTGAICSREQKQTPGGGTLILDDKTPNKITYVASQGFSGSYEISVRKLFGQTDSGTVRVEIIEHVGTPKQKVDIKTIKLDDAKAMTIRLDNGRRTDVAAVSPANAKKQATKAEVQLSGYEQLRRLSYPETTRGVARTQTSPAPSSMPAPAVKTPAGALPPPSFGVRAVGGDVVGPATREGNVHPVYQSLKSGASLAAVPGAR